MTRYLLPLLLLIIVALPVTAAPSGTQIEKQAMKPNIVVILADDLGRGDYSAFGTADIRTPHIDRLCQTGMELENFYANSPVCSPTRAALLTGCYPDRVGVPGVIRDVGSDSWGYLSRNATLLPKVLKAQGYHSALIGKWHLGIVSPNTPGERGFDLFHGFLGDMMDDYWTHLRNGHNFMRRNAETIEPTGHATDLFTAWACDYLNERKANANPNEPFFLYLAYNAPHSPVQPPPEWLARVKAREPNMNEKRAKLVALIEHMDDGIGQVLATLDRNGQAENTLVIFTSDNGGVLGEGANNGPWRSEKGHVYEGGLRVPFAARWPGHIAPGKSAHPALTMDIFSTLCAATGAAPPPGTDGLSFLPALLGQPQPEQERIAPREHYFVRREGGPAYAGKTIEALRVGDWKLLQDSPFAPLELYNLKTDPLERQNLATTEKPRLTDLAKALRRHIQQGGQVPWQEE